MRLWYWIRYAFEILLCGMVAGFVGGLLLIYSGEMSFADQIYNDISVYFSGGVCGVNAVMVYYLYTQRLPIAISFGSSRREAHIGIICCRLIPPFVAATIITVLLYLDKNEEMASIIGFCVFFILSLLPGVCSAYTGMIRVRYGKTAMIWFVIGLAVFFVGFVIFSISAANSELLWIKGFYALSLIVIVVLAIGLSFIMEHRIVYKYNVEL